MTVSFLDLPTEVILDFAVLLAVPTLRAVLSIPEIQQRLRHHIKIVLDHPRRSPIMFPFDHCFEVIRATSTRERYTHSVLYLVEVNMREGDSFHVDKFYPDDSGEYTSLQDVLAFYSGANSFLCLAIGHPEDLPPQQLYAYRPDNSILAMALNENFAAVHFSMGGGLTKKRPIPIKVHGRNLPSHFTVDEILGDEQLNALTHTSTDNVNMTLFSEEILERFLGLPCDCQSLVLGSTGHSQSTSTKWPLQREIFTWEMTNCALSFRDAMIALVHRVENVSFDIKKPRYGYLEPLDHQVGLEMAPKEYYVPKSHMNGTFTPPVIRGLTSHNMQSLTIDTLLTLPKISNIDLPRLSSLTIRYHANSLSVPHPDFGSVINAFCTCPIEHISVSDPGFLFTCSFLDNLKTIRDLDLRTSDVVEKFERLPLANLEVLDITVHPLKLRNATVKPSFRTPNLKELTFTMFSGTRTVAIVDFPKLERLVLDNMFTYSISNCPSLSEDSIEHYPNDTKLQFGGGIRRGNVPLITTSS